MTINRNKKIRLGKILVLILILSNLIIPLISVESNNHSYNKNLSESSIPKPKTQDFSKDLYNPIIEEEKYGLGSINITDLDLQYIGAGFNSTDNVSYSNYKQDLTSKALNMSFKHINFIKTSRIAQVDNLNENIEDFEKITVKLNETLSIQYNDTNTDYLIYASKLTPCVIDQLLVENNTESIKKVNDGNYSLIKPPETEINFLKFNYKNYFKLNTLNFTMHIIWRYNLTIDPWQLTQDISQELIISDEDNIVYPRFNYNFDIIGYKYNLTKDEFKKIPADDLLINLTIDLPDKNLLSSHRLSINGIRITTDFLHPDKSVYTKNLIRANESSIVIDFTTSFTLDFEDPVDYTWGIDRLVEDKDIRERIYFPRIISGPDHIFLKHVKILEETVSFDQVITATSLFKRIVLYKEINISEIEENIRNSLIFHEYATKRQGIKITLPYMIKGERSCPFIIRYETTNDLRIIITDNINMPLSDLEVVLYYYDEKFGTYISKDKSQPLGPSITDENGEILIEDVPNGNYTAKIYQRDSDDLIKKAEVSAYLDINYIVTPIIHFPLLILIFGGIGGIFFILGLIFYLKRENK